MKKKKKVINKRKAFMDIKKPSVCRVEKPTGSQDTIEVLAVAPSGIFQVTKDQWSKSFLMVDINYTPKTFDEQLAFFSDWCKTINAFDSYIKITVFNKYRDMQLIRDKILYKHKNDQYDWLRDSYNDLIETKIVDGKQGIEQVKIITLTCKRNEYEEAKASLATLEASLMNNFAALGSQLVPLRSTERMELLYNFYHPGKEQEFQFDLEQEIIHGHDWRNVIAPGYIDYESNIDEFETESYKGTCMYIDPSSYPTSLNDTFFNELVNNPFLSVFTIDFQPIPQDIAFRTLQEKLMGVENTIAKQQEKRNKNKNFSSEVSYKVRCEKEDIEKMLTDMRENDQKMYWVGVSMVLLGKDQKQFEHVVDTITQIVEKHMCSIEPYYYKQREALNTILPIGGRFVDRMRAMFTSSAGALMPFNVVEMSEKNNPIYYGVNQISKEPILANRKCLANGNGFVFGIPGGGKSFTGAKMEVGSVFLNTEDDIIFVDPTLEYFDVAKAYGGEIINLATYTKQYMNPLEVNLNDLSLHDQDGQIREKGEFMLGLVDQVMDGGLQPAHKSLVDRCVRNMFHAVATQPIEERRQLILTDFVDEMKQQKEKEAREIVLAMELFVDGGLNIFNHETNINVNNRVIVYGMRDLGENLYGISMLVMLENIRQRIINNAKIGRATWLYIDEFHGARRSVA